MQFMPDDELINFNTPQPYDQHGKREADDLYEQAMIEAAELVGPNSYEYDDLVESIYERLCCA